MNEYNSEGTYKMTIILDNRWIDISYLIVPNYTKMQQ